MLNILFVRNQNVNGESAVGMFRMVKKWRNKRGEERNDKLMQT